MNNLNGEVSRGFNGYSSFAPIDKQALLEQATRLASIRPENPDVKKLVESGQLGRDDEMEGVNTMNLNPGYNTPMQFNQTNIYQPTPINFGYNQPQMQQALTTDCSNMNGEDMCSIAKRKHLFENGTEYVDKRLKDDKGNLILPEPFNVIVNIKSIPCVGEEKPVTTYDEDEFDFDNTNTIDYNCYEGQTSIHDLFKNLLPKDSSSRRTPTFADSDAMSRVFFTEESKENYKERMNDMELDTISMSNSSSFMPVMYDFRKERQEREQFEQQFQQPPVQMQNMVAEQPTQQPGSQAHPNINAYSNLEKKNLLYGSENTEKIKDKCLNIIGRYRAFGGQSGISIEDLYAAYHTLNYGRSGLNFKNAIDDFVNMVDGGSEYTNPDFPIKGENFVYDPEKVKNDPNAVKVKTNFTENSIVVNKDKPAKSIKSLFKNLIPKKSLISEDNFENEEIKPNTHGDLNKLQKELGIEQKSYNTDDINRQMFNNFNGGWNQTMPAPRMKTFMEIQEEQKQMQEQQKMINRLNKNCMKYFGEEINTEKQEQEEDTKNKLTTEQIALLNEMIAINLRNEEMSISEELKRKKIQEEVNGHNFIRDNYLGYFDEKGDLFDFFENVGYLYGDILRSQQYLEDRKKKMSYTRSLEENNRLLHEIGIQKPYERVLTEAGIKITPGMTISEDGTLNISAPDFIKKKYEQRRAEYNQKRDDFMEMTRSKPRTLEKRKNFFTSGPHKGRVRSIR